MKKIIQISIPIIVILVLCFFLFKPVAIYNFGRERLGDFGHLQPNIEHNKPIQKKADSLLKSEFNKLNTPALSASIGINDKLIWSNTIGYANIDKKVVV